MSNSKKHHYLPQFYLEGFKIEPQETKYPHIWQIEKSKEPKACAPAIKDTGCMTDYHTMDIVNNNDRQFTEDKLSPIETKQAILLKEILTQNKILTNQKTNLAEFITLMFYRVPSFKFYVETVLKEVVKSTNRFLLRKGKLPPPPHSITKIIEEHGDDIFDVEISNWKILHDMYTAASDSDFIQLLKKMSCILYEAPEGCFFITSDSPVALFDPHYNKKKPYEVGLADKDIQLSIAIDRKHLILYCWNDIQGTYFAKPEDVIEYNRRVIIMGQRFIYSPFSEEGLLDLIKKNSEYNAGFDFSTLDYKDGFTHISRMIPVTIKR